MASLLYRIGRRLYGARRRVALVWLVILLASGGGAALLSTGTDNSFSIPGTEAGEALDQLSRTFPQVSGAGANLVIVAPDGESVRDDRIERAVTSSVERLGDLDQVAAVTDPFGERATGRISEDGTALIVSVQMDVNSPEVTAESRQQLADEADALRDDLPTGSEVALGGQAVTTSVPSVTPTEGIGVLVALVVLLVTFGSFRAAGMPLLTAIVGVAVTTAGIFIATSVTTISSSTPLLSLMLGLAVGIDYALFIISRHRDQLREGMPPEESVARALATAGSAVVFAGLTVMIALLGLSVAGIPFLTTMGVAAACGVAVAVIIALTLTPALLGFAGERMRPRASRRERTRRAAAERAATGAGTGTASPHPLAPRDSVADRFFRGWVRIATRRPIATIGAIVALLALAAVPAASLRLALPDAGSEPAGTGPRVAYDLIAERFGAGWNGPLIVTATIVGSTDPVELMDDLAGELRRLDGVASVPLSTPNESADTGIIQVIPEGSPDSVQTEQLVQRIRDDRGALRDEYGVEIAVTGQTAVGIDISARLGQALVPFGVIVVGLSLVLLAMVFRSVWVPVTAAVGFLLSVLAAFGAVGAVFAWGWGANLLHIDRTGPVLSFMPIVVMGVLFGLAMDYQVFLVSRMREDFVHGGTARDSVESGFTASAKVVTAAAAIMFAVFAAFVPEGDTDIKVIALGLAAGVLVDAFVVRMTLVPAVLHLLGDRAWWLPRGLARVLPSLDVEGEGLAKELALDGWPAEGREVAVAAQGLAVDGLFSGVDLRVPRGGALVIDGPDRGARSALLLTIAGRRAPDAGQLKVADLAAPMRALGIRRRVAVAALGGSSDPVEETRHALAGRPHILALDGLETVTHAEDRDGIRRMLAAAPGLTVIASCADPRALDALPDRAPVTTVAAATTATVVVATVTTKTADRAEPSLPGRGSDDPARSSVDGPTTDTMEVLR